MDDVCEKMKEMLACSDGYKANSKLYKMDVV